MKTKGDSERSEHVETKREKTRVPGGRERMGSATKKTNDDSGKSVCRQKERETRAAGRTGEHGAYDPCTPTSFSALTWIHCI